VPRTCSICSHEHRDAMEDAFIVGQAKRRIASHYGVTERAVRHHLREHLPALLALARDAERAARADTLLDRMEALQSQTLAILDAPEDQDEHGTALAAIREARRNLELIGEVTRELDRAGTINLELTVEWQEVKAVLVNTLASYPEAQQAVFNALEEAPNGN
jgi:predicted transcriptional regulator